MGKVSDADFAEIGGRLARAGARADAGASSAPAARASDVEPAPSAPRRRRRPACAACGTANDDDARFCKHCGARVVMPRDSSLAGVPGALVARAAPPRSRCRIRRRCPACRCRRRTCRPARSPCAWSAAASRTTSPDQPVEFTVDGKTQTVKTDDERPRAGHRPQARHARSTRSTVVDGERLESQDDHDRRDRHPRRARRRPIRKPTKRAAEDRAAGRRARRSRAPSSSGPSRASSPRCHDDRLNIFYVLEILNTARTPVDIGGPLIFDLPRDARGASLLEGSTPAGDGQRTARHRDRAIRAGHDVACRSASSCRTPAAPRASSSAGRRRSQQVTVLVAQIGELDSASPQLTTKQAMTDQGQPRRSSAPARRSRPGRRSTLEITGLPHHAALAALRRARARRRDHVAGHLGGVRSRRRAGASA